MPTMEQNLEKIFTNTDKEKQECHRIDEAVKEIEGIKSDSNRMQPSLKAHQKLQKEGKHDNKDKKWSHIKCIRMHKSLGKSFRKEIHQERSYRK